MGFLFAPREGTGTDLKVFSQRDNWIAFATVQSASRTEGCLIWISRPLQECRGMHHSAIMLIHRELKPASGVKRKVTRLYIFKGLTLAHVVSPVSREYAWGSGGTMPVAKGYIFKSRETPPRRRVRACSRYQPARGRCIEVPKKQFTNSVDILYGVCYFGVVKSN